MRLNIYGHGGSYNHGNEAIVRGVKEIFPSCDIILHSMLQESDYTYNLDDVCRIESMKVDFKKYSFNHITIKLYEIMTGKKDRRYDFIYKPFFDKIKKGEIYLLEAGDQYCENDSHRSMYAYINKKIRDKGGLTVMLGCTVNEEFLANENVIEDLNNYCLIVARESITYNALLKHNVRTKIILAPDPAFRLNAQEIKLPEIFSNNEVIGINTGFLKQGNEAYYDSLVNNAINLVDYILNNTTYNIALIPHVNWNYKDSDIRTLELIKNHFSDSKRIEIIQDNPAPVQKYIFSKCKYLFALRTHACIPSIASRVPTIVTGYKVKSTGIVYDIYPKEFELLAHVQSLKNSNVFVDKLLWLQENEEKVREYSAKNIPSYIEKTSIIREEIMNLYNENNRG